MSAVQTPGTPAPTEATTTEAAPAATEAADTGDALADALASWKGDEPAAADGEAAEKKPEPEAEKKPEGEKKKTRYDIEAELLEEGVLGTKEGIEKAKGYFRRRQSKLDGIEVRQTETARELTEARETMRQAYEAAQAELDTDRRRAVAIRQIDETLKNGSVEEMLETLGKIRGISGREVWDQMARKAIAMGKAAPVAAPAEIQKLESKIERLESLLTAREQREAEAAEAAETGEVAQLQEGLKQREAAVITAASDAAKFPELARYVKLGLGESIVSEVVKQKTAARRAGRQLDNAGALAHIEAELKRLPAGATPASPAGAKPASPAAVSADDLPIAGIAPSQTRSAGTVRDKTEAELAEDLAKDSGFFRDFLGIEM
ncbi:MAG TPA: hypothetical protein VFZ53_14290 [Polyangiaceae bacterium]